MSQYSQDDQQEWLLRYFGDHVGVAVDVGANDGTLFSNTLAMEERGWRVLCIEPNPDNYGKLLTRRQEVCQSAISDYTGTGQFSIVKLQKYDSDPGSSLTPLRILSVDHTISVPVTTLDILFEDHEIDHVDFLNLDIEGGEADALKGLNLDKYKPRLILIEDNHPPLPSLPECRTILNDDYIEVHRILDDVFFERVGK